MPTYDFICEDCDNIFEVSIAIEDYDKYKKQTCTKCNNTESVRRHYTPTGIKFGAGFFKDGYRSAKDVGSSNDE